jgi:UDP-N-acetylmuramoyl-L-alanyl-D-glutamate--2,6-diaminopimelate ligase
MFNKIKSFIKKLAPNKVLSYYHYFLALVADLYFGHPSGRMIVVGITGTKGKTTCANFVWSVLKETGSKVGQIGTANIRIGEKEFLNNFHMTMPGPFKLQHLLKQMADEGCGYCVLEATSEGMKLWRHIGIDFDAAIFTNLTPEHLPSHNNSFEEYKKEKGKLFQALSNNRKVIKGTSIKRISIINSDSEHADYFSSFPAGKKYTYGISSNADLKAGDIQETSEGVSFEAGGALFKLSILGGFNVLNALPAILLGRTLGIADEKINFALSNLENIPGRMEIIDKGQNFKAIVDYAHEKISMNAVLDTAQKIAGGKKIILLLGAEGGGRDKTKRAAMGESAAKKADFVICSNVDPYEDDPFPIANDIAIAAEQAGMTREQNLFVILDRRKGIKKALSLAQEGDVVLITGKGAEQSITIGGKASAWDDRVVVAEEIQKSMS